MSEFNCTRCGALVVTPAAGAGVNCPKCGQRFESSAAAPAESSRPERWQDPYDAEDRPRGFGRDDPPARPTHSGLGVASFIIGLLVLLLDLLMLVLLLAVGGGPGSRVPQPRHDTAAAVGSLFVIFNCIGVLGCLVGLGLGVAGLFQEHRNRTFAIVGVILNGLVILAVAVLFIVVLIAAERWGF